MTRTVPKSAVDIAVRKISEVGESPIWDDQRHELIWVDIPAGHIHRWAGGSVGTVPVGQPLGAVALRHDDGLVLALRDGFGLWRAEAPVTLAVAVEADRTASRMNDGKVDRSGRFWAGTMSQRQEPGAGALYRLNPDLSVIRVLDGLGLPNGIVWSDDDRTMYFIDSLNGRVDAFDHEPETGSLSRRRSIITIPAELGLPDGMTIDRDGNLWVAIWGGACVRRYRPDGTLDTVVELPTRNITSCVLGGSHLSELYITSAFADLTPADRQAEPEAGMVFRVEVDVPGLAPMRFAR